MNSTKSIFFDLRSNSVFFLVLCVFGLQEIAYLFLAPDNFDGVVKTYKFFGATVFRVLLELQFAMLLTVIPRALLLFALSAIHVLLISAVLLCIEGDLLLTPSLILANFKEGATVVKAMGIALHTRSVIYLLLSNVLFVGALALAWRGARARLSRTFLVPLAILVIIDATYISLVDPPYRITKFVSNARMMLSYGYLGFSIIEMRYVAFADHQASFQSFLADRNNGLPTLVAPLSSMPSSIYVVQWESLDFLALAELPEEAFIRKFARSVGVNRLQAEHINGSSDTDFSINTGLPTSRNLNPYLLAPTGYEQYLPRILAEYGYSTDFVHCNSGKFFSRSRRVAEFGYQNIYWAESFKKSVAGELFWGLDDADCVDHIIKNVGLRPRQFMYFITLTSHYPYRNTPESHSLSNESDRYLVEIAHVSKAIERLLIALPQKALVLIFGDHRAVGLGLDASEQEIPLFCAVKQGSRFEGCKLGLGNTIKVWDLPRHLTALLGQPTVPLLPLEQ